MNNRKGGKLPLLFGYRPLIALLLCGNMITAGLIIQQTQKHTAAAPATSASATDCSKVPASLSAVKISPKRPGLTHVASDPLYYDVGGATLAEINTRMAACGTATQGEFAASTSYVINWQISYQTTHSGQCQVDKVSVGLHTQSTYPRRSDIDDAIANSWYTFMQHLTTHEAGHVALDKQYATQILHTLQELPADNCQAIDQKATATASSLVRSLDQANNNYDAATGHGRTQGAALQ